MGKLANLSLSGKVLAALAAIAVSGATTGVSLAAASSSNGSGNGGPSAGAPPQPVIGSSGLPTNPTNATTATFTYTDSRPAVSFVCSLDNAPVSSCSSSGITYGATSPGLGNGTHTFRVEAQNGNGPLSSPASFTWTIANQQFRISGDLTAPLGPGIPPQRLDLAITNPYSFTMKVTGITVTVSSTSNSACLPSNFATTGYSGSFTVPAGTNEKMTSAGVSYTDLPTVQMLDLPTNQDTCQGVKLNLAYSGTVTTP